MEQEKRRRQRLELKEIERQLSAIPAYGDLEICHNHARDVIIFSVWRGGAPVNRKEMHIPKTMVTALFTWKDGVPSCPDREFYKRNRELFEKLILASGGTVEPTLEDKLETAYRVACEVCYCGPDPFARDAVIRDTVEIFGEEISDLLWSYADGSMQARHDGIKNGTTPFVSDKYDPDEEERAVEDHIKLFEKLKRKIKGMGGNIPVMSRSAYSNSSPGV